MLVMVVRIETFVVVVVGYYYVKTEVLVEFV